MITKAINIYDSSLVRESVYEYETKLLTITFPSAIYHYHDVSVEDYEEFAESDSQGKALNSIIKNKYEFTKIETEDVID
jgi:hypothetical protein|tara:strand:+ start:2245 stop:2481 length:237 start_codon:yes stop_codon:yes gene_type:complete